MFWMKNPQSPRRLNKDEAKWEGLADSAKHNNPERCCLKGLLCRSRAGYHKSLLLVLEVTGSSLLLLSCDIMECNVRWNIKRMC